jgi:hypothetical protein
MRVDSAGLENKPVIRIDTSRYSWYHHINTMAKSKKNLLAAFAILGALLGGGCVPPLVQNQTQIEQPANTPNGSTASKTVESEYGFSFLYPATYVIDHRSPTEADIKTGYTDKGLDAPKDQYILIQESEVRADDFIGEGAPPVSVMYWANEKNLSLEEQLVFWF